MSLSELRSLEGKATPFDSLKVICYDHGGGRVYVPGNADDSTGRQLVADFYDEDNREAWLALRNAAPLLLDCAEWVQDRMEHDDDCDYSGLKVRVKPEYTSEKDSNGHSMPSEAVRVVRGSAPTLTHGKGDAVVTNERIWWYGLKPEWLERLPCTCGLDSLRERLKEV